MKAGKITAKIRDAVQVSFMENGDERARYRNIEIPDALKDLEIKDFGFNILLDGKIEFQLMFDKGILPEKFPAKRPKVTRAQKAAMKVAAVDAKGTQVALTATVAAQAEAGTAKPAGADMAAMKPTAPATAIAAAVMPVVDAAKPPTSSAKTMEVKDAKPTSPVAAKPTTKAAPAPKKESAPAKKDTSAKDAEKK